MDKFRQYKGFATVTSDFFNNTPNLDIDILPRPGEEPTAFPKRESSTCCATPTRKTMRTYQEAPTDQYQVILEVADAGRSQAGRPGLLYIKSDDNENLCRLSALVNWKTTLRAAGRQPLQPVHQRHLLLQP